MDCFNAVHDFLQFTAKGFLCLLWMELVGADSLDDKPHDHTGEASDQDLEESAHKILQAVWSVPSQVMIDDVIDAVDDKKPPQYCYCGKGNGKHW